MIKSLGQAGSYGFIRSSVREVGTHGFGSIVQLSATGPSQGNVEWSRFEIICGEAAQRELLAGWVVLTNHLLHYISIYLVRKNGTKAQIMTLEVTISYAVPPPPQMEELPFRAATTVVVC